MVAATTEKYISIHQTFCSGLNGYTHSIKSVKSDPIKLELSHEIIEQHALGEAAFTKAKFDNVYESEEKYVISTIGHLLLIWKLEDLWEDNKNPIVKLFDISNFLTIFLDYSP